MTFTISNINIDELLNTDIDSLKTPRSPSVSTARYTPALPSNSPSASPAPKTSRAAMSELDAAENELLDMLNQQLAPNTASTPPAAAPLSAGT